jgi:hypothetical protein
MSIMHGKERTMRQDTIVAVRTRRLLIIATTAWLLTLLVAVRPPSQAAPPVASYDVTCNGTDVGKVIFSSYQDTTTYDGQGKAVGSYSILLEGGFNPNANWNLPADDAYRWLQTVNTTAPIYGWQAASTTYMDRSRTAVAPNKTVGDGSPFYAFYRGPANGFTLGFEDNPSRLNDVTQPFSGTWTLYLVCADVSKGDVSNANQNPAVAGKRDIMAMTSFTWGFTINNGTVALTPLANQTGAAFNATYAALDTAFTGDPDTNTFKDSWTLSQGCCGAPVPEGSAWLQFATLAGAAGLSLIRGRCRRV